jgi:acyl carrier protein
MPPPVTDESGRFMSENARLIIRDFMSNSFPRVTLNDDQDLFKLGYVNSLFALELIVFIENQFGLKLRNEDMQPGNFVTISAMVKLVDRVAESRSGAPSRGGL